jgi:transcriptional regulator with XRE-family HTH domain
MTFMQHDKTSAELMEQALAKQIKIELINSNMSQTRLAELVGIDRTTVNRYLNGKLPMGFDDVVGMANALGMNLSELARRAEALLPQEDQKP